MRIAICLSGQPRTWNKCLPNWLEKIAKQGEVDFFFHFWDYNTLPSLLASHNGGIPIEDEPLGPLDKWEIVEALKPKKFQFESRKPIGYWNCEIPPERQFGHWCAEQFYSLYRVSLLKRQYEMENKFKYDVVIRSRGDLWLENDFVIEKPVPNTMYSAHCSWDQTYNVYRVGDIFYYADSHTFDEIALFWKFLSFVPTEWVTPVDCPPPEIALYFYLANMGIINNPTHISMKVMRTDKYKDLKGGLDGYEVI